MNKKRVEPEELRISAVEFDAMMRRALGVPPPSEQPTTKSSVKPKPKTVKRKKDGDS